MDSKYQIEIANLKQKLAQLEANLKAGFYSYDPVLMDAMYEQAKVLSQSGVPITILTLQKKFYIERERAEKLIEKLKAENLI